MKPSAEVLIARRMLENREKGFTFALFFRQNLKRYLIQIVTYTAAIALVASMEIWPAVWICGGIVTGAFLRDIGWVRSIRKRWPLSVALTDWEKVQQLADGNPVNPIRLSTASSPPPMLPP